MSYNLAQIQQLLAQSGWPDSLIPKYAAIVIYESGGNVNAIGDNHTSFGLLQIHNVHTDFDFSRYADAIYNLSYAYRLYQREGDHAWYTSVQKYNRDYQGTATLSASIYNSGGQLDNGQYYNPIVTNTVTDANQPDYVLWVALGALAFLALK